MSNMASHISILAKERNTGRTGIRLIGEDGVLVDDYDTILRELFCVTADALAAKTRDNLHDVGTLWDEIFVTGEASRNAAPRHRIKNSYKSSLHSLAEKGFWQNNGQEYGRGCLMFLVRKVDSKLEAEKLEASGYRFAEVHQVLSSIQSSMHIKTPDLEARLRNMSNQKDATSMLTPGVHVGMFAVRARLDRSGFDVLAQKTARNLLPSVSMSIDHLEHWQVGFLNFLRSMTLGTILLKLKSHQHTSPEEKRFVTTLRDAISSLRDSLSDEAFDDATLLPKEVQLPCSAKADSTPLSKCTLIAFQLVLPIHARVLSAKCEFTPLSLFKMRQLTYKGSSHHVEFSHMVHRDLSSTVRDVSSRRYSANPQVPSKYCHLAVGKVRNNLSAYRRHGTISTLPPTKSQEQLFKVVLHPSSLYNGYDGSFEDARKLSSASHLSTSKDLQCSQCKDQSKQFHVFGGIMVSQEVSINVQKTHNGDDDSSRPEQNGSELKTLRSRADNQGKIEAYYTATATGENAATLQGKQQEAAFVDELLALSMQADKRVAV